MQFSEMFMLSKMPNEESISIDTTDLERIYQLSSSDNSILSAIVINENIITNKKQASHVLRFKSPFINNSETFVASFSDYVGNNDSDDVSELIVNCISKFQASPQQQMTPFGTLQNFCSNGSGGSYPQLGSQQHDDFPRFDSIKYRINKDYTFVYPDGTKNTVPIAIVIRKIIGGNNLRDKILASVSFSIPDEHTDGKFQFLSHDVDCWTMCRTIISNIMGADENSILGLGVHCDIFDVLCCKYPSMAFKNFEYASAGCNKTTLGQRMGMGARKTVGSFEIPKNELEHNKKS